MYLVFCPANWSYLYEGIWGYFRLVLSIFSPFLGFLILFNDLQVALWNISQWLETLLVGSLLFYYLLTQKKAMIFHDGVLCASRCGGLNWQMGFFVLPSNKNSNEHWLELLLGFSFCVQHLLYCHCSSLYISIIFISTSSVWICCLGQLLCSGYWPPHQKCSQQLSGCSISALSMAGFERP